MENCIEVKKERHGGIDLFRIISMFMVVVLHINGAGGILRNPANQALSPLWFVSSMIQVLCVIGVNCFALITGYVNVGRKTKIKNLLNLWLQAFFISIIGFIVKIVLKEESFSIILLIKRMLPVIFNTWWYFTAYFLLFFFIPILNIALEKCGKVFMGILIIALGVIFCGIGFIAPHDVFGLVSGYSFLWLAYLYLVGAYIKKYDFKIRIKGQPIKNGYYLVAYFVFSLLHLGVGLLQSYLGGWKEVPVQSNYVFILNLLASISLLLFFANIKIKSSKTLLWISSTTFGVYLMHTAIGITGRFAFLLDYHWAITVVCIFAFAIAICLVCAILEYLRQLLFKLCRIPIILEKIQKVLINQYSKLKEKYELNVKMQNETTLVQKEIKKEKTNERNHTCGGQGNEVVPNDESGVETTSSNLR